MFRFFRSNNKYPLSPTAIPLELNYYNKEADDFEFIGYYERAKEINLRAFFVNDNGELVTRYVKPDDDNPNYEHETKDERLTETVMKFFQQLFEKVLGL
jgi:hypothetical protein